MDSPRSFARRRVVVAVAGLLTVAAVLTGLRFAASGSEPAAATSGSTAAPMPLKGSLTIFAASSLTDAFREIGKAFTAAHPGVTVEFNFAASSALAVQINERAPADVFASADDVQMRVVTGAGNGASEPEVVATNRPVIVVPTGDGAVVSFDDLGNRGVALVLASASVPIGRYAREILSRASAAGGIAPDFSAHVLANLKSDEANARAVLTKVQLGEADAGIVYETDAKAGGSEVRIIDIPNAFNVVAQYPIVALRGSKNADAAAAFVAFVRSGRGQDILARFGFGAAPR